MRVAFRVDSSHQIGHGHFMRCLTLADAFANRGAEILFLSRALDGSLNEPILERDYKQVFLLNRHCSKDPCFVDWREDASDACSAIKQHFSYKLDWLIVDHYGLDFRWCEALSFLTSGVMLIDDLANRKLVCDVLLNQSLGITAASYTDHLNSEAKLLLGPQYALLRETFFKLRSKALAKRKRLKRVKRILVSMGGADFHNLTNLVLLGIDQLNVDLEIDVVLTKGATHLNIIEEFVLKRPRMNLHLNASHMAQLMLDADLAIGTPGITSWERCCLGLPALLMISSENQIKNAIELQEAGAAELLGSRDFVDVKQIANASLQLISNVEKIKSMSACAAVLCDGMGTKRVLESLGKEGVREYVDA